MNRALLSAAAAALLLCIAAAGCEQPARQSAAPAATSAAPRPVAPAREIAGLEETAPWLNPLAEVHTMLRADTPAGVELRQAVYLASGSVLLLRDYQRRDAARPDLQWLVELRPVAGADAGAMQVDGGRLAQPQSALPSRILPGPERRQAAILGWLPVEGQQEAASNRASTLEPAAAEGAAPVDGEVTAGTDDTAEPEPPPADPGYDLVRPLCWLLAGPAAAQPTQIEDETDTAAAPDPESASAESRFSAVPSSAHLPVLYGADGALYFRPLGGAALKAGLIEARADWTASPALWKPGTAEGLRTVDDPALLVSPDLSLAAGLLPALQAASPAQPGWELFLWRSGRGVKSRLLTTLPVAADSLPDDSASLFWLDSARLALLCPQPAGRDRLNWQLLSISTAKGEAALVADHLPAQSRIAALDGCLLYCRPAGSADAWELWAASADGRTKRLLYSAADTVNLSIADAHGGRLLLNRQYFGEGGTSLHHGLIELALSPLLKWRADARLLASPLSNPNIEFGGTDSAGARRGGSSSDSFFIPDSDAGGSADPGDRYRRRDGGGGSGGGGGGGGRNEPPDLSLPGL